MKNFLSRSSLVLSLTVLALAPALALAKDPDPHKAERLALLRDCEAQNKFISEFIDLLNASVKFCKKTLTLIEDVDPSGKSKPSEKRMTKLMTEMGEVNEEMIRIQAEQMDEKRAESVKLRRSGISDKRLEKLAQKCEAKWLVDFEKRDAKIAEIGVCKDKMVKKLTELKQQAQAQNTDKGSAQQLSGGFGGVNPGTSGTSGTSGAVENKD